ncbi:MAG: hypothetical protein P4N60_13340 [Verrucomicrobiae bacterium]|nr:hypothetical protein [Verrucomicrobiae bacterium]
MTFHLICRALLVLLLFCLHAPAQTTLPPLRITSTNRLSTVHWPLAGYSAILQTATSLSPAANWTNLVTGDPQASSFFYAASGGHTIVITNISASELTFTLSNLNRQQFFRLASPRLINPCGFAVFYNGLLEFSQSSALTFNGRVHSEGPIQAGSGGVVTFQAPVTSVSTLSSPMADGLGPWTTADWNVVFNGNPKYVTNSVSLSYYTNNYHFLIDVPPANEDPGSGLLRLYNEAPVIILVTNDVQGGANPTVQMILQASYNANLPGADPAKLVLTYTNISPASLQTNLPFLSLTGSFYDQREYKTSLVTQIDVGNLASWMNTNVIFQGKLPAANGQYPVILFVADRRNVTAGQLAVVRLKNGAQLPYNNTLGFTVATPNPLYVLGNYNVQTSFSSANAAAGTTNTSFTVPAALMSDSLTVLSTAWSDNESYTAYNNSIFAYDAVDTTINAAIFAGTVASTGNDANSFSGGLHNLPRLLEDWTGKNFWLNTAIIRLWDSQKATNQFRNPQGFNPAPPNPYYNAPTRHFNYDARYLNLDKVPPGVPLLD